MQYISPVVLVILAAAAVVLLIKLLKKPLRWIFKLLLNALIGFVMLFAVNFFGGFIGVSLTISWLNAIVAGVLGFPGIILLLLFKYII